MGLKLGVNVVGIYGEASWLLFCVRRKMDRDWGNPLMNIFI